MPWPEYFLNIALLVAERSTCLRRKVGAVAVKDKRILATGYNGAPAGVRHCDVAGCLRAQLAIPSGQRHEMCRGLHAEQNVIVQAAVHGVSLDGADIFCTAQPCLICAKMLINCNISTIWHAGPYPDPMAEAMLAEAGISLRRLALPEKAEVSDREESVGGRPASG
jgi:dCMP deaminase